MCMCIERGDFKVVLVKYEGIVPVSIKVYAIQNHSDYWKVFKYLIRSANSYEQTAKQHGVCK